MGIAGLSKSLRDVATPVNLGACFPNARLGVDISHWFHTSVYPSVEAFVLRPSAHLGHVERIVQRASRLRATLGCDPIFVFDGAALPSKSAEHEKRAKERTDSLLLANRARDPKKRLKLFSKAAERSMEYWTNPVFHALVRSGFKCVMAPYEADPQLAYMSRRGDVDVVLSRDGDMLAHGCKVVALDLDERDGSALVVRRENLRTHPSFKNLSPDSFVHVCILSGCDYLDRSVFPRMGIKRFVNVFRDAGGDENAVMRVFKNLGATDEQMRAFVSALVTFAHAYVLCPSTWQVVNLSTVCARDPGGPRYALCPLPPDAYLRKRCGEKPSAPLSVSGARLSGEYDTTAV